MAKIKECLLIEDDHDDQEIFQMALLDVDTQVHCTFADSGEEALTMLNDTRGYTPDVIFIDINMPVMNGMECFHSIKRLNHSNQTKIYMYSTSAEVYSINEDGVRPDGFIVKPSSLAALVEILSDIFNKLG